MSNKRKKKNSARSDIAPRETPSANALTVAWMVTITTLLFSDTAIAGAHFLSRANPEAQGLRLMKELLLILGAGLGTLSLVLLPFVYRVRSVAPPTGLAVFGGCLAAAPVLALVVRNWVY